jgi:hypothetical protein
MGTQTSPVVPVVTAEKIEAAMQKGRRERSLAFWRMVQDIFGRSEDRATESDTLPQPSRSRMAAGSR